MNSNAFIRIVVTFAIMILAFWVSLDIFSGGGNSLGKFYFYVMLASGLFGLLSPKRAFFYLIFLAAYLDFFKRLMILDHGIRMLDLYWVLGIAPATMAGITVSVLYQLSFGGGRIRPLEGRLVLATVMIFALLFGIGIMSMGGGKGRALGDLVNTAIYIPMVFVVPYLFRTPGDVQGMIKFMIYVFVPSALYLIYQSFAGLTWWEHRYLQSGLSIEARHYAEKIFRCFGTMSAASAATNFYSLFTVLLLASGLWNYTRNGDRANRSLPLLRILLAFIYAFAAYRTFSRAGWILGILVVLFLVAFRFRTLTLTMYATLSICLVSIVLMSGYLLKHKILNKLDMERSAASEEAQQASRLATFNDRLEGFYELTHNRHIWTPFGMRLAGKTSLMENVFRHDAFTEALMRLGYVPLGSFMIGTLLLLRYLHQFVFAAQPGLMKNIACMGLSGFVGLSIGGVANSAMFLTFPQNLLIYLCLGSCVAMIVWARSEELAQEPETPAPRPMNRQMRDRPAPRHPAYA